jgi:LCP family protein required for cell wall assembly
MVATCGALLAFPDIRAAAAAAWPAATPAQTFGSPRVLLLVMGSDRDYGTNGQRIDAPGRSDTMMLADLDLDGGKAHLISIPRDTEAEIPGRGMHKINAAYAFGGVDLSRRTVENLIGAKVDHTVAVNLDAFRDAVDALGGVDVTVEKPLRYTDHWANLEINIPAGPNHLDGEHAMQFVRFRHDAMADIGRVKRQQDFMRALREAMQKPSAIAQWPGVVRAVASHTETDLTPAQMIALGRFAKSLPKGSLVTETLPGAFHRSGWRPDKVAMKRLAFRS